MRIVCSLVFAIAFALAPGAAPVQAGQNGAIDLFPFGIDPSTAQLTTPDFGACQVTVSTPTGRLMRVAFGVYARLSGATLAGISLAELYVQGVETNAPGQLPPGWLKNIILRPEVFTVGSLSEPFTANQETVRRCDVVWSASMPEDPDCQRDPLVLLAIVDLIAFTPTPNFPNNHYVTVTAGIPSNPPSMGCPYLQLCDSPVFTRFCVSGGQLIINPAGPSCTVALQQATWSRVKDLYR